VRARRTPRSHPPSGESLKKLAQEARAQDARAHEARVGSAFGLVMVEHSQVQLAAAQLARSPPAAAAQLARAHDARV
jgi:hypothetical protein